MSRLLNIYFKLYLAVFRGGHDPLLKYSLEDEITFKVNETFLVI